MIITIGGNPGSGKSTLAKMLAAALGYAHYDVGSMRREMARKKGMTLQEFNALGEKETWTDEEVDQYQKRLGQEQNNLVVEGRMSFFFIPHSLKVFIDVDPRTGAQRVFKELQNSTARNEDTNLKSVEAVFESHKKRIASDIARYQKYYHTNVYDKHYDYVLDTSDLNIQQAFDALNSFVAQKLKHHAKTTGMGKTNLG